MLQQEIHIVHVNNLHLCMLSTCMLSNLHLASVLVSLPWLFTLVKLVEEDRVLLNLIFYNMFM